MSSSSFVSCLTWSDRGTINWTRKSSAALDISLQQEGWTNKLLVVATNAEFVPAFWLFLADSVVRSKVLYQSHWEQDPVPFLLLGSNPPLITTTQSSSCVETITCPFPEEHKFIETKYETGGKNRWAKIEQGYLFFLFQYQKNGKRNASSLPKVVPYYTLMYAHTHSHTLIHNHMHLQ